MTISPSEIILILIAIFVAAGLFCVVRPPERLLRRLGVPIEPTREERQVAEGRARVLLRQLLGERQIALVLEDSARRLLAREGYDPNYGARPLKRAIQTLIQNPLAVRLLRGEIQPGQTIHASAEGDEMKFATEAAAAAA